MGALSGLVAAALVDSPPLAGSSDIFWASSFLAFPAVGLVLAIKRPRNPVGWLFEVGPGLVLWGVALDEAGSQELGETVFAVGLVSILAAVLLFPDGRYPARWWAYAHGLSLVGMVVEGRIAPTDGEVSIVVLLLLAVGSLIVRVVRGSSIERRQIGLPVFIAVSGVAAILVFSTLYEGQSALGDWIGVLLFAYLLIGIPVGIGVSILRYRLYDLDRFLSRTVTYVVVIALLAAVYAGGVFVLTEVRHGQSDLAVAASTLLAAGLFNPLRRRVQRLVDRRFYRSRYDAQRVVEEFSARLRDEVDLEQLLSEWVGVVQETVQPIAVSVWVRERV